MAKRIHPSIVRGEMGWEWLEDALEADQRGALPPRETSDDDLPPPLPNPATEGVDWIRDEAGHIYHPLSYRAFESAVAIWQFCDDRDLLGDDGDTDLQEMVFEFQTTSAKPAGALNALSYHDENSQRGGFVVAALKRALGYLHKSIAAAEKVATRNLIPRERLDLFRADLFSIREEMLGLMQRFREEGA